MRVQSANALFSLSSGTVTLRGLDSNCSFADSDVSSRAKCFHCIHRELKASFDADILVLDCSFPDSSLQGTFT